MAGRALKVLHERHYQGEPSSELVARAELGNYLPALDRAMASALAGSLEQDGVRTAIAAIAARTEDRELAQELTILLARE